MDLDGKVVVVSGATGALGSRVVEGFASAGASVAALVRKPGERRWPSGNVKVFQCDVTDESSVVSAFGEIEREHGRVFAYIHTVGVWAGSPLTETSVTDWTRILELNVTSAFLCFRQAVAAMRDGPGRLIGVASRQGADEGRASQAAYSASKGGLIRLIESIAKEHGPRITANAIAPSTILYEEPAESPGVPVRDLVDLCLFVCSEAGASLNGSTLRAYGTG